MFSALAIYVVPTLAKDYIAPLLQLHLWSSTPRRFLLCTLYIQLVGNIVACVGDRRCADFSQSLLGLRGRGHCRGSRREVVAPQQVRPG